MRISDWSSDLCSSDLIEAHLQEARTHLRRLPRARALRRLEALEQAKGPDARRHQRGQQHDPAAHHQQQKHHGGDGQAAPLQAAGDLARVRLDEPAPEKQQGDQQGDTENEILHGPPAAPRLFHLMSELRHERSEEHTSELQSLMRISYAVFCLKKKIKKK